MKHRRVTARELAHARSEKLMDAALAKQELAAIKHEVEEEEMRKRRIITNSAVRAKRLIHPIVTLSEIRHGARREGQSEADHIQELEVAKAVDAERTNQRKPTKSERQAQLPKIYNKGE